MIFLKKKTASKKTNKKDAKPNIEKSKTTTKETVKKEKKPKTCIFSDKKTRYLIIAIIGLILIILGLLIVTIGLKNNKTVVDPTPTPDPTPGTSSSNLTAEEFKARYLKFNEDRLELMQKIQKDLLAEAKKNQDPLFERVSDEINLNKEELKICMNNNLDLDGLFENEEAEILEKIFEDTYLAQMLGINGTPTLLLNGDYIGGYLPYKELKEEIEKALLEEKPEEDYFFSETDTFYGDKNAKVKLYVFSDYYCSYCKLFVEESLMQLKKDYIDTGKIQYIPKNMISMDPTVAVYVRCAEEQNKYFEAESKIFNNSAELSLILQDAEEKTVSKYEKEIENINKEYEILQNWAEENPELLESVLGSLEPEEM